LAVRSAILATAWLLVRLVSATAQSELLAHFGQTKSELTGLVNLV